MTDVFLYAGETPQGYVKLSDPTILRGGTIGVLAGVIAGVAVDSATLIGKGGLAGSIAGIATDIATANGFGALAGSMAGTASDSATIAAKGSLAGSASGIASLSGSLTSPSMSGSIHGSSTTTAIISSAARRHTPITQASGWPKRKIHIAGERQSMAWQRKTKRSRRN